MDPKGIDRKIWADGRREARLSRRHDATEEKKQAEWRRNHNEDEPSLRQDKEPGTAERLQPKQEDERPPYMKTERGAKDAVHTQRLAAAVQLTARFQAMAGEFVGAYGFHNAEAMSLTAALRILPTQGQTQ